MIRASGIQQTVSLEERSRLGTGGTVIITQHTGHRNRTAPPKCHKTVLSSESRLELAFSSDETKLVHSHAVPPEAEFRGQTLEPARPGSSLKHDAPVPRLPPPASHLPPVKWD